MPKDAETTAKCCCDSWQKKAASQKEGCSEMALVHHVCDARENVLRCPAEKGCL